MASSAAKGTTSNDNDHDDADTVADESGVADGDDDDVYNGILTITLGGSTIKVVFAGLYRSALGRGMTPKGIKEASVTHDAGLTA